MAEESRRRWGRIVGDRANWPAKQPSGNFRDMAAASEPRVVLIVDDNPEMRQSLRDLLELLGHRVLEASNGDEALNQMANEAIDVVVTDLYMPGLNGMELMREIARRRHRPKVIAMTGVTNLDSAGTANAVTKLGACALLIKPFSIERLTDTFADL